ncbi:hypothetical protein HPB47_004520 [Ixodes persulcatus]|uniref:Uncharacterized protein n=1 Tax=Ixodes persulcatus TaxID=34615 RepID=A0AC60PFL3_IXOPE|nr:hypothetical protein HPB47_004520 [Ixodes persulcatus]
MKSGLYTRTDAAFLLKFLRARKFDVDRAFTLLKNYYGYRSRHRKIFQDLLPSALHSNLRYNYQTLLPGRDRKGRAILIMFHGSDMSSLHEHISPEVLPQEYGGGGGHMDNQDFVAALLESEESFRRDLQYGYADK